MKEITKTSGTKLEKTIDSREVAEMLGKGHAELLKEIEGRKDGKNVGIIPALEKGNFHLSKYFIASAYQSGTREYKCYKITKLGCELLGNKQQGEKGILFTAKYVERFNQMEEHIKLPQTYEEMIMMQAKSMMEFKGEVETKFVKIEDKLDNQITLDHGMQRTLQKAVAKRVIELLGGKNSSNYKKYSKKYFSALYRDIKDRMGVPSYKDVKTKDYVQVLDYIKYWVAPANIKES